MSREALKLPLESKKLPNPSEAGDAELLRSFQRGETAAFAALVRHWEDPAFRIAYRVTGDHAAAEDVRQTVFLRLLEKPHAIRDAARFATWLRRSIVNEAINVVRKTRRVHSRPAAALETERGRESPELAALDQAEEVERLDAALGRLAPDDRALLSLRFEEELTFQEIAAVSGKPISTIKTQVQRAVARLHRVIDGF